MSNMSTTKQAPTTRTWTASGPDDGSVHCLGNGQMCVYEEGPNITQIFDLGSASAADTGFFVPIEKLLSADQLATVTDS